MKKPSHIPLFPDAYHRDTTHLTTEEHGAYFLLMMAAWGSDDCTLPNDERRLAALAKMPVAKWRKIAPTVLEFWTIEKGRISQGRLLKEWHYVREKSAKNSKSANKRWEIEKGAKKPSGSDANAYANAMHLGGGGGVISSDTIPGRSDENPFGVIEGGRA